MVRLLTLNSLEKQASNFSLQYHVIKHEGHENKGNDHQLKQFLIMLTNFPYQCLYNKYLMQQDKNENLAYLGDIL